MLTKAHSNSAVPLDLASLRAMNSGGIGPALEWPTPYEQYAFLSRAFVDQLCAAARAAANTPELEAVAESKLYDTVTDLSVIARLALDLGNVRSSGKAAVYDKSSSAWLAFIDEGGSDASSLFDRARWHYTDGGSLRSKAKRLGKRLQSDLLAHAVPHEGRHDVLSRNGLVNQYFSDFPQRSVDISPNYRDWPVPAEIPSEVKGLVSALSEAFAQAIKQTTQDNGHLLGPAGALAGQVISGHIGRAWADLMRIRSAISGRRAGAYLSGGTPKHIGRLYAWQYRQFGREVLRFAHGGERAFYEDYAWGLAELPFCDRYYCHSRGEAEHVARRHAEGRMAPAGIEGMTFAGIGSRHHQMLRERSRTAPRSGDGRTVMYVAGGYLGETLGDFPSRKPPDALYVEWQIWLLQAMKSLGFNVLTKVHPKGINNEAGVLGPHCNGTIGGFFDPLSHDADCYVFDFAGTAFFDALASGRGVVLLDMGVRPRDEAAFDDLRSRCEVVTCTAGEGNRFRLDMVELQGALEVASAAKDWPEAFFEAYFRA